MDTSDSRQYSYDCLNSCTTNIAKSNSDHLYSRGVQKAILHLILVSKFHE